MSAYMVEDKTINRIVNWLKREVFRNSYLKEKTEKVLGISVGSDKWAQTVGKALFKLNIDGVNDRYGEGEAQRFRKLNYAYLPDHPTTLYTSLGARIQVLKSMQCFLYQCMEGEVVKNPLYRLFREVVEPHLMSSIIHDLPEYDEAEWG